MFRVLGTFSMCMYVMATETGGRDLKASQSYPIRFGLALVSLNLDLVQRSWLQQFCPLA